MGISGCGKSLSVKAIADIWKLPLFKLDMNLVFSESYGPAEGVFHDALRFMESVAPAVLWLDDETDAECERDIFATVLAGPFPEGPWTETWRLPPPISQEGEAEIQPFFDGDNLWVSRDNGIYKVRLIGSDIFDSASWQEAEPILLTEDLCYTPGKIVGVGEPNVAVINDRQVLFFVYILVAEDETYDLNIGFLESP